MRTSADVLPVGIEKEKYFLIRDNMMKIEKDIDVMPVAQIEPALVQSFKKAIDYIVFPHANVLTFGSGTGMLSSFAAARAQKVWCVESNPLHARESQRLQEINGNAGKMEIVCRDSSEYLPPEPVDVVICDMIHAAIILENNINAMESFKKRYIKRFGASLPRMVPTAILMAVQPLQQNYSFDGFSTPMAIIQDAPANLSGAVVMATSQLFGINDMDKDTSQDVAWEGNFVIENNGTVNSLQFIRKKVLAIVKETMTTIDCPNQYISFPLEKPINVLIGETLKISFVYRSVDHITSLQVNLLRS